VVRYEKTGKTSGIAAPIKATAKTFDTSEKRGIKLTYLVVPNQIHVLRATVQKKWQY